MLQYSAYARYGMVCQHQCMLDAMHRSLSTGDQGLIAFCVLGRRFCNVYLVYVVAPRS